MTSGLDLDALQALAEKADLGSSEGWAARFQLLAKVSTLLAELRQHREQRWEYVLFIVGPSGTKRRLITSSRQFTSEQIAQEQRLSGALHIEQRRRPSGDWEPVPPEEQP